jgi:hypothetical protein
VVVVADDPGGEPRSEHMAVAVMAPVEALGVDAVQVLHPRGQSLGGRLEDEVVVRAHQAERMAIPPVAPDDEPEQPEEPEAVVVVDEDQASKHAARGHVEDAVGHVAPADARHASDRSPPTRPPDTRWTNRHEIGTAAVS